MTLLDQVRHIPHGIASIAEWLGDGGKVVEGSEAQARADVCLKCPLNEPTPMLTAAVAAAVHRHLEVKNKLGLRVVGEKSLGSCSACGCSIRLLIWLEHDKVKSELTDEEKPLLPNHCWKLKP